MKTLGKMTGMGCRYLNLLATDLPDDCWYDAQHLNIRGAKRFTPILRAALHTGGGL